MSQPLFVTVEEPQSGDRWTYVIRQSPALLGRDPGSNDIVLRRESVSKIQSEITFDDARISYRDLDSRNGSIVNGEPIPADVPVDITETSDVVVGGRLRLTFSRTAPTQEPVGPSPFDPPRLKSSPVSEPTAVHVGELPARPQIRPAAAVPSAEAKGPPVWIAPAPVAPMPAPHEEPMMTERVPVPEPVPSAPPPAPFDQLDEVATPIPLNPGDIVAHYRVEGLIGRGGMGTVYKVSHVRIPAKRFAMKVLSPDVVGHPEAEARFMREAEAASRIEHPHVVSIVDFGRDRGITYLIMEFLKGEDLASLIAKRTLSTERIADIMLAVCAGVSAAHKLGIVHRDLKPANIFLGRNDMGETVPKVLDFGISKLRMPGEENLTQRCSLIGTPNYLSPEQARGGTVDARSDVYALGTILYECVTGRLCHQGDSLYDILHSIAEAEYPSPIALRPDLDPRFNGVIKKALERNPDDRFQTAFELGGELVRHGSPKRQRPWTEFYLSLNRGQVESSSFVVPISLSKYDEQPQARTELLPEAKRKPIAVLPVRRDPTPPAPASSSDSSRGRRASRSHDPSWRELPPADATTKRPGRWMVPAIASVLVCATLVAGFAIYSHRASVDAEAPSPLRTPLQPAAASLPQPAPTEPTPTAALAQPLPAKAPLAQPPAPGSPSPSPPRRHTRPATPRQDHAARALDQRFVPPVARNRNGVPLLKP